MTKKMLITTAILVIALIVSLAATTLLYIDNQNLNKDKQTAAESWANRNTYTGVLLSIAAANNRTSFGPLVDQMGALQIAYGYGANNVWNQSALEMLGTTRVDMNMVYGYFDQATNTTVVLNTVTEPQSSYAHVKSNGVTYRYMWQIIAYNAESDIMPLTHDGYCLVDAYTGEQIPVPPS
jgi:hypothetical protein